MTTSTVVLPNSLVEIQKRSASRQVSRTWPLVMLFARLVLFAFFQACIAMVYALSGNPAPWEASIAWWLVTATLANFTCLGLLARLARREGMRFLDLYRVEKHPIGRELLVALGVFLLSAPLAYLPNVALGTLLFGNYSLTFDMMFRPMPLWALYPSFVLFPVSIALAELPTYYSYAMPRLAALSKRGWTAVLLAAFMHAAQHCTLPLIFDGRFLLWRLLMFLPFALLVATVLYRRPRLLPYLMIGHGLLDAQLLFMFLSVSH